MRMFDLCEINLILQKWFQNVRYVLILSHSNSFNRQHNIPSCVCITRIFIEVKMSLYRHKGVCCGVDEMVFITSHQP